MRIFCWFPTILLLFVCNSAVALTPWQRLDDRPASAADFIDQQTGLVAFQGPSNIITKFDSGSESAVYATTDSIGSIVIADTESAWAVVHGNKLLHGTKRWTLWKEVYTSSTNIKLIFADSSHLFYLENGNLRVAYTFPSGTFATTGIPQNQLTSIAKMNDDTYFASTSTTVYRSNSSGTRWDVVLSGLRNISSIYADAFNNLVYLGGDTIMVSTDIGVHWLPLTPPPSLGRPTLDGQVYGTNDCTGTFYLSNGIEASGNILRSTDLGKTLVTAGRFPVSSYDIEKGWVFDRGSTFYWWDKTGILSVSTIGLDSLIVQGIVPEFYVTGTDMEASLCPSPTISVPLEMHVATCYQIQVDSVTVVAATGNYQTTFTPFLVGQNVTVFNLPYTTVKAGSEETTLRVWYRMLNHPGKQSKDVSVRITTSSAPAALQLSQSLEFAKVTVDSSVSRSITITNSGCDALRVDSVVSSAPELFTVAPTLFPFSLASSESRAISIRFLPTKSGGSIEALEIGTSAGHRFLEVSGEGVGDILNVTNDVDRSLHFSVSPNPAQRLVTVQAKDILDNADIPNIGSQTSELYDALGRHLRSFTFLGNQTTLNLSDLTQGEYFIRVSSQLIPFLIQR